MSTPNAQVALVHGGGIELAPTDPLGWQLQPGSTARAEKAVELFQGGVVESLLFSGGNAHGHDLPQTEAVLMADIATRAGVSVKHIKVEPGSSSTIGNWANSLGMLQEMDVESVMGVTGRIARPRAQGIGVSLIRHYGLGVKLVGYSTTKEPASPDAIARELTATPLAAAWLANAARKGRSLDELDRAYRDRRANSHIAQIKQHFTHR